MRNKLGKLGLLMLGLVLVVGTMGAAYASWWDEVEISGEVTTGTLDLEVMRYSGTYVWKVPGGANNETLEWHGWMDELDVWMLDNLPANAIEVAYSYMRPADDGENADVVGVAHNIFPYDSFTMDVVLHYNGSIPAMVYAEQTFLEGDQALMDIMGWDYSVPEPKAIYDTATVGSCDVDGEFIPADFDNGFGPGRINLYNGYQMHYCECLLLEVIMDIPQDNNLQGLSATWGVDIKAVQWNEWPVTD